MTEQLQDRKPLGLIAVSIAAVIAVLYLMAPGVLACPPWTGFWASVLVGVAFAWVAWRWDRRKQTLVAIAVLSSGTVATGVAVAWADSARNTDLFLLSPLFYAIIAPLSCFALVTKKYRGLAPLILLAGLVFLGSLAGYVQVNLNRDYTFVGDVTIPDGTLMKPGDRFTKTWRLKNCGLRTWRGYSLAFLRGDRMGAPSTVPVPPTRFGETVDISVEMQAPEADGSYRGDWRVHKADGDALSRWKRVFVEIEVD